MKKILIIKTSPRKGGNSDRLADEFARGAREKGHQVEEVSLVGKEIAFCKGCLVCGKTQRCVIHDDADIIREKMLHTEVIVWATPVYYYSCSGQMKTMIDRSNPLYNSDYEFRETYLLAAAAENEEHAVEGAKTALQGWVDCFDRLEMKGVVFAGGVNEKGDIEGHPALAEAYRLGLGC